MATRHEAPVEAGPAPIPKARTLKEERRAAVAKGKSEARSLTKEERAVKVEELIASLDRACKAIHANLAEDLKSGFVKEGDNELYRELRVFDHDLNYEYTRTLTGGVQHTVKFTIRFIEITSRSEEYKKLMAAIKKAGYMTRLVWRRRSRSSAQEATLIISHITGTAIAKKLVSFLNP